MTVLLHYLINSQNNFFSFPYSFNLRGMFDHILRDICNIFVYIFLR